MKKYFNIKNIIIVVLVLIALLEFLNPKGFMPNRVDHIKGDSIPYPVHDTIPVEMLVEVEVPVEVPVEVEKRVEVPVIQPVDTAEILKIYFAKNFFNNTIKLSNNMGTVSIVDTISQNKIVGRDVKYNIKQKIVKDTIYTPEPRKSQVYFGVDAKFDKPNVINLMGIGLLFKTKDEKIYKVGVGVSNNVIDGTNGTLTPYIGGGVYWKIKLKK